MIRCFDAFPPFEFEVVNIGPPYDTDTYFHRIGRAGRYGGYGVGVTVLTSEWEVAKFKALAKRGNFHVKILGRNFPEDITTNTVYFDKQTDFVAPSDRPDAGDGAKSGVLRENGHESRKKSQTATPHATDLVPSSKQAAEKESRKPVSYDSQEATSNANQVSSEPTKLSNSDSTKKSSSDPTPAVSNEDLKAKTDQKPITTAPISAENKIFESNLQAATNGIQKIRIDSHADSTNSDATSAPPLKISTLQGKTFGRSFTPATGFGKLFKPAEKPSSASATAEKPSIQAALAEKPSNTSTTAEKLRKASVPPMVSEESKDEPLVAAGTPSCYGAVKAVADSISSLKGKSFGKGFASATTLGKLFAPAKKATPKPEPVVEDCSEAKEDVKKAPKTEPEVQPPTPKPFKVEPSVEPVKPVEVAVAVTQLEAPEVPVEGSPVNPKPSKPDPSVEQAKPVEAVVIGTEASEIQAPVQPEPSKPEPSVEPIKTDEPVAPVSTSPEAPSKPLTAYSRDQMHEIRDSRDSAAWEAYARSSPWDTVTDPFQFDPELRCSVSEQLKVLQRREKLFYKQKLAELNEEKERQKANVAAIMAYASAAKEFASGMQPSGIIGVDEVKSVLSLASCKSWDEFVSRLDAFTAKSEEKRAKFVQGPMVFPRSTPEEFDTILDMIGPRLQKKTDQVVASIRAARSEVDAQTSTKKPAVSTIEISTQTDFPPPVQADPAVVPKANAREELTVEGSEETESESEYTYSTDTIDADFEADGREHWYWTLPAMLTVSSQSGFNHTRFPELMNLSINFAHYGDGTFENVASIVNFCNLFPNLFNVMFTIVQTRVTFARDVAFYQKLREAFVETPCKANLKFYLQHTLDTTPSKETGEVLTSEEVQAILDPLDYKVNPDYSGFCTIIDGGLHKMEHSVLIEMPPPGRLY